MSFSVKFSSFEKVKESDDVSSCKMSLAKLYLKILKAIPYSKVRWVFQTFQDNMQN